MNTEERAKILQEAKRFAIAEPVVRPMIESRKQSALLRLIRDFREGKLDNAAIVAEISVLDSIEREMNAKLEYLNLKEK